MCCDLGNFLKLSQTLKKLLLVTVSLRHTGIRFTLEAVKLLDKFWNQLPFEPIWEGETTFDTESPGSSCTVLHWFLTFYASQTTLFVIRLTVDHNLDILSIAIFFFFFATSILSVLSHSCNVLRPIT